MGEINSLVKVAKYHFGDLIKKAVKESNIDLINALRKLADRGPDAMGGSTINKTISESDLGHQYIGKLDTPLFAALQSSLVQATNKKYHNVTDELDRATAKIYDQLGISPSYIDRGFYKTPAAKSAKSAKKGNPYTENEAWKRSVMDSNEKAHANASKKKSPVGRAFEDA